MRKKYIKLIVGVLIIAVLAFMYFFLFSDDDLENNSDDDIQEDSVKIIDVAKEKVSSIVLQNDGLITEIIPKENEEGQWIIKGFENVDLNQSNIDSFVESMSALSAFEVKNADKNLSQYGLDIKESSIKIISDDGEHIVWLGTSTADNAYYYVKKDSADTVYKVDSLNGNRFKYTINDFIDKSLPQVSPYKILRLNIKQKNKEEIDLEYTQNKEGNAENLIAMGMETMNMNKPYPGLAIYPSNLQENVLYNLSDIQLGELVDVSSENFAKYGINDPDAEINVSDDTNSLKIIVGKKADDKNYWCTVNDKNSVFLIDEKYITPFLEADPVKFVEKFVALYYRADLQKVVMNNNVKKYEISFGAEETKEENNNSENSENQNSRFNDDRKTYLNGKEVDKETFGSLFELITGITFDSIDKTVEAISQNPEVIIKYTLKDGSSEEVKFLPFNDSFYVVDGKSIKGMLVSKQNVSRVFEKADQILSKS